jgi:opacity protein-like surface antigen
MGFRASEPQLCVSSKQNTKNSKRRLIMHINVKSYSSDALLKGNDAGKDGKSCLIVALGTGLMFWLGLIGFFFWIAISNSFANGATPSANDPLVMKVYPDGTKVILRWSEVFLYFDNGSTHGGAPKIMAYDPAKDGIVPIGQPSNSQTQSPVMPNPEQEKPVVANPASNELSSYGPTTGFGFRTDCGVAFQQAQSFRQDNGATYNKVTYQPGIRFDLEPFYNVTEWFSVGVESAFIYNSIHSIYESGVDEDTGEALTGTLYNGDSNLGNAALYQVPILANVRFQLPTDGPIRGYFGGGVGGVWDYLNASVTLGDEPFTATSFQWNYAFQLNAGLIYNVMPGLDFDAGFKTLCTPNPLTQGGDGQYKAAYSYAAEIGLVWRF